MRYAIVDKQRVEAANSGDRGLCECCGAPVVAKCGQIVSWHWAHVSGDDCDSFSEPMTEWHRRWQDYLAKECGATIEVVMRKGDQAHRADAVLPSGLVVELQHSSISIEEMEARESFYGEKQMLWVFDCRDAYDSGRFELRERGSYQSFRWKHPRKSIAYAKAPARLDLGEGLVFRLKRIHREVPCGGWGVMNYVPALDEDAGDVGEW